MKVHRVFLGLSYKKEKKMKNLDLETFYDNQEMNSDLRDLLDQKNALGPGSYVITEKPKSE